MPDPVLRLVTPSRANAKSIKAFENELDDLGWNAGTNLDYPGAYAANGKNSELGSLAQQAVTEAQAAVTAGGARRDCRRWNNGSNRSPKSHDNNSDHYGGRG